MKANISRRAFLQSAGLMAIATTLPVALNARKTQAQAPATAPLQNARFHRFKLGNFQLATVSDGILRPPAALFAGRVSPEQLAEVLQQGFQTETLTIDCNVLFVDTGSHKVLVDTGNGGSSGPAAGKLIENLASIQINPTDIDTIIITHAHGDHVGGLTVEAGTLAFPNARYYVPRVEWDFWTGRNVSLPNLQWGPEMAQSMISVAQKQLATIRDRVTRFEVNREIIPGFTAISTPGHTPGHVSLRITSGDASMVHVADVVHTHTINLWHPEWKPLFDADPVQAAATRQAVLTKIASDRTLMFAYHFPFPGVGYVRRRSEGGFEWEPLHWEFEV